MCGERHEKASKHHHHTLVLAYLLCALFPPASARSALNMDNRYRISRDRYNGHDPPSFSSTLLDSIYRSFDDSARDSSRSIRQREEAVFFREMAVKSGSNSFPDRRNRGVGGADGRRSREQIVDSWMEFGDRRRSLPSETKLKSSAITVSSSDSSSLGLSSSDTDSLYGSRKKKTLQPIRTSFADYCETLRPPPSQSESFSDDLLYRKSRRSDEKPPKGDGSGGGRTAKSRAMKFYGDLKRMKQPISPGGKLANFLNSLFNATGNAKKQRISTSCPARATGDRCDGGRWERSESKSNYTTTSTPTCSTASSYSRSCLSKTPSSAGAKRSVRFSPVSVVIDEDLRPCGHKSLHGDEILTTSTTRSTNPKSAMGGESAMTLDQELKLQAMDKNRRVEAAAMELLRNYNNKWEINAAKEAVMADVDDRGEDEDAESCCSSDLFELENLLEIGVDRYCAELPVYETTHVDTNRAIASGFIV